MRKIHVFTFILFLNFSDYVIEVAEFPGFDVDRCSNKEGAEYKVENNIYLIYVFHKAMINPHIFVEERYDVYDSYRRKNDI